MPLQELPYGKKSERVSGQSHLLHGSNTYLNVRYCVSCTTISIQNLVRGSSMSCALVGVKVEAASAHSFFHKRQSYLKSMASEEVREKEDT